MDNFSALLTLAWLLNKGASDLNFSSQLQVS